MLSGKIKAFVCSFSTVCIRVTLTASITVILLLLTVLVLFLVGVFKFGVCETATIAPTPTITVRTAAVFKADSNPRVANEEVHTTVATKNVKKLENGGTKTLSVAQSAPYDATHNNVSLSGTTVTTTTEQPISRLDIDDAFLANPTINESTVEAIKNRYKRNYEYLDDNSWHSNYSFLFKRRIKKVTVWKLGAGFRMTLDINRDAYRDIFHFFSNSLPTNTIRIYGTKKWGDKEVIELLVDLRNAIVYAYYLKNFYFFYGCEDFLFGSTYAKKLFHSRDEYANTILASLKANEEFVEMTHFEELRDDKGQILLGRDSKTGKLIRKLSSRSWANLFNHSKTVRFKTFYGFLQIEDGGKVGAMSAFDSRLYVSQNRTVASMGDKRYDYTCKQMNVSKMEIKISWAPNESCAIEPHEKTDAVLLYETHESKDSYVTLTSGSLYEEIKFFSKRKKIRIEVLNTYKLIYDSVENLAVCVTINLPRYKLLVNRSASIMGYYGYDSLLEISQHRIVLEMGYYKIVLNETTISFESDNEEKCALWISLDELKNKDYKRNEKCENDLANVEISGSRLVANYGAAKLTLIYASGSIQINTLAIESGDKLALQSESGTAVVRFSSAMFPLNIWSATTTAEESRNDEKEEQNDFDPKLSNYINSLQTNELLRIYSDWAEIWMNATNTRINSGYGVITLKRS